MTQISISPLADKVAIVTGANTGIGRAAALKLAGLGAKVVLAARREPELLQVATEISQLGGVAHVIAVDIADPVAVERLVRETVETFGRLDIAFNNAGVSSFGTIDQFDVSEFDRVIATNVRGVFLLLKHEITAMRAAGNGGAIVNTSSIAATGATAGLSTYAASKAALDAATRVIALEVGADGIRINNVSPGVTLTPMTEQMPDEMVAGIAHHTAVKRVAQPEDIGDVAVWLCGDDARYITGQSILADGGFNLPGAR